MEQYPSSFLISYKTAAASRLALEHICSQHRPPRQAGDEPLLLRSRREAEEGGSTERSRGPYGRGGGTAAASSSSLLPPGQQGGGAGGAWPAALGSHRPRRARRLVSTGPHPRRPWRLATGTSLFELLRRHSTTCIIHIIPLAFDLPRALVRSESRSQLNLKWRVLTILTPSALRPCSWSLLFAGHVIPGSPAHQYCNALICRVTSLRLTLFS